MNKIIVSVLVISAFAFSTKAQVSKSFIEKVSIGVSYGITKPQGKFGDKHFSYLSPNNLGAFTEGEIPDVSLADFLDNSFAKQGNQFSVFAEYDKDEHFGAYLQWTNSEFNLYESEIQSLELLFNQFLEGQSELITEIGLRVTEWKSNSIVIGPKVKQSYGKFSIHAKAGVGVLMLESPTFTAGVNEILGLPIRIDAVTIPEVSQSSFIYSLGLATQYEVLNKTSLRIAMDYSKSNVKMKDISIQPISSEIELEIPLEFSKPVEIDVDYQTLNFSLAIIRNI